MTTKYRVLFWRDDIPGFADCATLDEAIIMAEKEFGRVIDMNTGIMVFIKTEPDYD